VNAVVVASLIALIIFGVPMAFVTVWLIMRAQVVAPRERAR
jgi:hypothetical protein